MVENKADLLVLGQRGEQRFSQKETMQMEITSLIRQTKNIQTLGTLLNLYIINCQLLFSRAHVLAASFTPFSRDEDTQSGAEPSVSNYLHHLVNMSCVPLLLSKQHPLLSQSLPES